MQLNFQVDLNQAHGLTDQDLDEVKRLMSDVVAEALAARLQRRGVMHNQLVNLLAGDVAMTPVDLKRARLEGQAVRAIRQSTEWLTAAEIGHLADLGPANPSATVSRWKQQGRTFALRHGSKNYYPRYTMGTDFHPLPVIKEILSLLAGYDPELLACWFDSTSSFLSGKRPREIVGYEPAMALAAARHMFEVQENQA